MLAAEMDPKTEPSTEQVDLNKVKTNKEFRSVEGKYDVWRQFILNQIYILPTLITEKLIS